MRAAKGVADTAGAQDAQALASCDGQRDHPSGGAASEECADAPPLDLQPATPVLSRRGGAWPADPSAPSDAAGAGEGGGGGACAAALAPIQDLQPLEISTIAADTCASEPAASLVPSSPQEAISPWAAVASSCEVGRCAGSWDGEAG
ncbi:hypothetical protein MNEG_9682 [Monoraphidium neglectum]|uniref:Uncharacterized protein n=1 Tax=Monoraphidium neglectum TaxID=145388 RepID=A0A0D2MBP2_9CHLO|nr:hypothetical protein MNEG_9682 [Monoraphidium neglectum]KIY98281.1 hypothetical protein MNEG_9682 [Monoraphidium neglectum]|eukprot:XP_013897301.1 hypothetical protein MNEG_9682 [Monoraphidium neglectum]